VFESGVRPAYAELTLVLFFLSRSNDRWLSISICCVFEPVSGFQGTRRPLRKRGARVII